MWNIDIWVIPPPKYITITQRKYRRLKKYKGLNGERILQTKSNVCVYFKLEDKDLNIFTSMALALTLKGLRW